MTKVHLEKPKNSGRQVWGRAVCGNGPQGWEVSKEKWDNCYTTIPSRVTCKNCLRNPLELWRREMDFKREVLRMKEQQSETAMDEYLDALGMCRAISEQLGIEYSEEE